MYYLTQIGMVTIDNFMNSNSNYNEMQTQTSSSIYINKFKK